MSLYDYKPKGFPLDVWNLVLRGVFNESLDTEVHLINYLTDQGLINNQDNIFNDDYLSKYKDCFEDLVILRKIIIELGCEFNFGRMARRAIDQLRETNSKYPK